MLCFVGYRSHGPLRPFDMIVFHDVIRLFHTELLIERNRYADRIIHLLISTPKSLNTSPLKLFAEVFQIVFVLFFPREDERMMGILLFLAQHGQLVSPAYHMKPSAFIQNDLRYISEICFIAVIRYFTIIIDQS